MSDKLTNKEKKILNDKFIKIGRTQTIKNTGNYLIDSFQKLEGFDFRWTSLISNNPLLFEDINYLKIKDYIDNTVTDYELEAYKNGDLTELYANFDNLLVCNLKYYDRIINYCTMILMKYVTINDETFTQGLNNMTMELELTPTKIWCAVMVSESSTKFEIQYGWNIKNIQVPIKMSTKSVLELNYKHIYRSSKAFAKFNEYNSVRLGMNGYRQCFMFENTPNRKLAQVCQKFTKTSVAISETQLDTVYNYSKEIDNINEKLYHSLDNCLSIMFKGDKSQYSVYILMNEFYIFTSKFSLKVSRNEGKISKDYLANSYECFVAEEYLVPSFKSQIEWSQHIIDSNYDYDKNILKSLLSNLLEDDYKNIVCISKTLDINDTELTDGKKKDNKLVKAVFTGIFNNVKITENFMINNRAIRQTVKVLSKKNAASHLIDKGYYLFGYEEDVNKLLEKETIKKVDLIEHYSKYCIPVINFMSNVVSMHQLNHNEMNEVILTGNLNPENISNSEIIYTTIHSKDEFNPKNIFSKQLRKITDSLETNKKSYWKVIE